MFILEPPSEYLQFFLLYPKYPVYLHKSCLNRCKAQNIKEVTLSLNHYQQLSTFLLHTIIQIDTSFLIIQCKDSANRTQNKMNLFIFYAKVQPIFAFRAKIVQTECRIK